MYLIFDTETTGLPKNWDLPYTDLDNWPRLVQIAWQLHDQNGKILNYQNFIVKPEGFTIPYSSEKVHGISTEIALAEGKELDFVLKKFDDDIQKAQALIGHNIEFDMNIMGAEFLRKSIETKLHSTETICTKLTSTDFVGIPNGRGSFKWATLTELHQKLFGKGFGDAHDAAYDVAATARCFFGLIKEGVIEAKNNILPENITYQEPELDAANFVRKKDQSENKVPEKFRRNKAADEIIPFYHLHTHSQFSILQSTADTKVLVKTAKKNGMNAIAITDHGNLHGAFNAVSAGSSEGVKVIIGCEFYVAEDRKRHQFTKNDRDFRFSQVLLATSQEAYVSLSQLCSLGYIEGYYSGMPRIDKALIKEFSEGLIALSGGYFNYSNEMYGEIPYLILNKNEKEAEAAFVWYKEVFGDNFYAEIVRHGLEEEERINEVILKFADKYDVKPVATNNVYYIHQSDSEAHDTLLCVKEGHTKSTEIGWGRNKRFQFPNNQYYFKNTQEMNELFADIPIALETTQEIVDKCSNLKLYRDILMPNFQIPEGFVDQDDYLKFLTYAGAKRHYGEITTEIEQRLELELTTIKNMGFSGYFLIVQDFINAARKMGVAVGPGRGCLTGDTLIVLENGKTKRLDTIQINDKVITLDGSVKTVRNTFCYEIQNEELLNIKTYYGDFQGVTLTKDHKVFAEKQTYPKNYATWANSTRQARKMPEPAGECQWERAENLQKGDWLFIPTPKNAIWDKEKIDLAEFANGKELLFDESFIYHHVRNTLCGTDQKVKKVKRFLNLDEDWFRIFGIFAGDGWVRKDERPQISFVFFKEDTEKLNFVKNKFLAMGFDYSEKFVKNTIQLHINNRFLYLFFKNLFKNYESTPQTKHIPDLVLHAPEKLAFAFLQGYNWADGHEDKHKFRFTTVSKVLADQVRFLCWRLGLPAALGQDNRTETREAFKNSGLVYYITIPKHQLIGENHSEKHYFYKKVKNGILVKIRDIQKVQGINKVYDFEVDQNHNYLTTSFLVHNSAAGSAVAYCTGITNIDPILYNLLFERFLNPERVSMPDIDIDFDDEGRQAVIDYVIKKYGQNQVAQIVTYGTMAAKMSIKDVARAFEMPLAEANELAKLVPEKAGTKLQTAIEEIPELKEINNDDPKKNAKTKVLKNALILEGSVRGTGIHAAGVIIAPDDLMNYIPVCTSKDADLWVTQFDGKVVESAGMLKMDFLGLKTLTIIKDALKLIKKNYNIEIDIDKIPLEDKPTFELYQRGDTVGTFQFESDGMRKYLKDLKPTNIEDLIAMNALYRPGPLQYIPVYIDRKHGREKVEYPHPLIEPILKPTYGIMIYQEQIMQTAQILAGYTLGGADILRRAMGKKKKEEMEKQRAIFVEGCQKTNQIPAQKAGEIFDVMEAFASYGFNRSHSAAYSVVAYQTAYLKANYPAEYMASVMTHSMGTIEKISFFMEECKRTGVEVLGPDVNESGSNFDVNKKKQVRFGLGAIKGAGDSAVAGIIEEREEKGLFKNIYDFAERMSSKSVNKKTLESLAYAGAFDSFNTIHRSQYFYIPEGENKSGIEKLIKYGADKQSEKNSSQSSLFGGGSSAKMSEPKLPECPRWSKLEELKFERDVVGFFISGHPLDQFKTQIQNLATCRLSQIHLFQNKEVKVAAVITSVTQKTAKNGNPFITFNAEDYDSMLNLAVFGEDYSKFREIIKENEFVLIKGKVVEKFNQAGTWEIKVQQIDRLEEIQEKSVRFLKLTINLEKAQNNPQILKDLEKLADQHKGKLDLKFVFTNHEKTIELETISKKYKVSSSFLDNLVGFDVEGVLG